jgi:hypothetical protein
MKAAGRPSHGPGGVLIAVGRFRTALRGFLATPADHEAVRASCHPPSSKARSRPRTSSATQDNLAATISRLVSRRRQSDTGDARHRCRPSAGRRHRHLLRCEHVERASRCRGAIPEPAEWRGVVGPRARHDDDAGVEVTRRRPHLSLHLAPYESGFVVFSNGEPGDCPPCSLGGQSPFSSAHPVTLTRMAFGRRTSGPARTARGRLTRRGVLLGRRALRRNLHGSSRFSPGAVLTFGDGAPVARDATQERHRAWLDSPVREVAVVYVTASALAQYGARRSTLHSTVCCTRARTRFRIDVANLAVNAMAGRALPDYVS